MVGAFLWDQFIPAVKPAMTKSARIDQEAVVRRETYALRDQAKEFRTLSDKFVWSAQAEAVGAQALDAVTRRCRAQKVSLGAFRPQRMATESGLERLPFVATLEGSYLGVMRTIRTLETGEDRLAVTLIQVNQADPMGDRVNATLGLSAFRKPTPVRRVTAPVTPAASMKTPAGGRL